jgi:hypothetical protein
LGSVTGAAGAGASPHSGAVTGWQPTAWRDRAPVRSVVMEVIKLFMEIDVNMLNNVFYWANLKFPLDLML